jgi:uncharacterized protein (PEP-CTERM system associated)
MLLMAEQRRCGRGSDPPKRQVTTEGWTPSGRRPLQCAARQRGLGLLLLCIGLAAWPALAQETLPTPEEGPAAPSELTPEEGPAPPQPAPSQLPPAQEEPSPLTPPELPPVPHVPASEAGPEWKFTPGVAAYGSYTSNATLAPPGQAKSDFFADLTPSIGITGNTSRLKFNLDYSLEAIGYAQETGLSELRNHLDLVTTATLAPDLLYVDGRAIVQQYPSIAQRPVSGSALAASSNLETVTSLSLSPYIRHHFGNFAESELRYTLNQGTGGGIPDSLTNRLTGTLISGSQFKRLLWTLRADGASTIYSGSGTSSTGASTGSRPNSSSALGLADVEYRLNRTYGLLASVGYEVIDDPTLTDQPNGPIGSVGVRWTPGPRTSVVLNLNHRFDDTFVSGDASYLLTPRARITASYTEQIVTSQTLFANDLSFLVTDEFGNFIDARTAQLFSLGGSNFGLETDAFKLKSFNAGLHGAQGRNTFDAIGYYETRDVESTGEFDRAVGGALNWGRELSRLTTLNLTLRYRDTTFDVPGAPDHQQLVGAGASLVYHMNETLDGIGAVNYTRQFADIPDNEFSELIVSFGLAKHF